MSVHSTICKNCQNSFRGKFCNHCGQKKFQESDKRILAFIEESLHFVTHFDGTIFTTLKSILTKPGKLSLDYTSGVRKRYFKPMSFFLLLVVLYLLFPMADGLNMRMDYHMEGQYYGEYATKKINHYLQTHPGISKQQLADIFANKSEKTSKILLLLIVPVCALVLWALGFFRRKYFYDHMVLSAELNSFFLLSNFFIIPLVLLLVLFTSEAMGSPIKGITDEIFTITGQIATGLFAVIALRRYYGFKWWYTIVAASIFVYFHDFIVYVLYKFVLFITVINLIH